MKEPDYDALEFDLMAYHGAGTAVASYLLHKRFTYVTMNQIRDAVYFGDKRRNILKFKRKYPSERELKLIKREVMIYLAGPIAAGIHFGRGDYEDVRDILVLKSQLNEEERRIGEYWWKWDFEDTKLLIYAPWNWHAIDALADELQKKEKIRYKEVRKIIREAIEDYHEAVKNGEIAVDPCVDQGYLDFVKQVEEKKAKSAYKPFSEKDFHIFSKEKTSELKRTLLKELKKRGFKILSIDTRKGVGWVRYKIEVAKTKVLKTDISPYLKEILAIVQEYFPNAKVLYNLETFVAVAWVIRNNDQISGPMIKKSNSVD
jgi:hypothetical protein